MAKGTAMHTAPLEEKSEARYVSRKAVAQCRLLWKLGSRRLRGTDSPREARPRRASRGAAAAI